MYSNCTPLSFPTSLAGWFAKDEVRSIEYRILDKAATYISSTSNPLELHFFYQTQIEIYYRDRGTQEGLDRAIIAWQRQIAYAPTSASTFKHEYPTQPLPSHKGYTQLAIVLWDQGKYREVIDLCSAAKNDGWYGDWDQGIARCDKKLNSA